MSSDPPLRLSATVMTRNSLRTLERCLSSLDFCDEVVVADDFSTDGTWEALQSAGPKVRAFQSKLTTFSAQRRALHQAARGEWLLILDADEEATAALAAELKTLLDSGPPLNAYSIPLRNLLPPYWTPRPHFTVRQKRLLRRSTASWADTDFVHAPATYPGATGKLRGHLEHHSFDSLEHFLRKQVAYGASGGRTLHAQGRRASGLKALGRFAATFLKYWIGKGLFRFGSGGFFAAWGLAHGAFHKYALLWDLGQGRPVHERAEVPTERRG